MSLQYDEIGGHYNSIKSLPLDMIQTATAQASIGNIDGQEVLDLACGSGYYSRKAIEQGARRIVGLDISSAMIEAAQRELGQHDARFDFRVADYCKPLSSLKLGQFDLVLAMWFLNYASTAEEQFAMWRNMAAHVKPGGRCIGIVPNFNRFSEPSSSPEGQFGSRMEVVDRFPDGVKYQCSLSVDPPISFQGYLLRRGVYESGAQEAGFVELRWLGPVDPGDRRVDFSALPRHMLCQVFEARRAA